MFDLEDFANTLGRIRVTDISMSQDQHPEVRGILMYHDFHSSHIGAMDPIKKVIFNNPATIVLWKDGSKTVVKCGPNDEFDIEKGLSMAIAKKFLGNRGNYNNIIKNT